MYYQKPYPSATKLLRLCMNGTFVIGCQQLQLRRGSGNLVRKDKIGLSGHLNVPGANKTNTHLDKQTHRLSCSL